MVDSHHLEPQGYLVHGAPYGCHDPKFSKVCPAKGTPWGPIRRSAIDGVLSVSLNGGNEEVQIGA